jgi:hypothetical protein
MWLVVVPVLVVVLVARLTGVPLRRPPAMLGALAAVVAIAAVLLALTPLRTWQDATIGRQLECGSVLRPSSGEDPCPHARADRAWRSLALLGGAVAVAGVGVAWWRRESGRGDLREDRAHDGA